MTEQWKDIPEFEGMYKINENGVVKSLSRYVNGKIGVKNLLQERTMKYSCTQDGYAQVALSKNHKLCSFRVHVLVAKLFIGNKPNGHQVNHIDGNKLNNHYSNLEWVTPSENINHAISIGLRKTLFGDDSPRSKRVINTISGKVFGSAKIAASEIGMHPDHLRTRLNGKVKNFTSLKYIS